MSQIPDIAFAPTAPKARPAAKPKKTVAEMSDAELADGHFGHTMALMRAKGEIEAIEAELDRRGKVAAIGAKGFVSRQLGDIGLVDLKKLRADLGDAIWADYAIPGSDRFWRSRSLSAIERDACTST